MIGAAPLSVPDQLWWYVARSGGIVALLLVGLSVVWGLALSTRLLGGTPPPAWLLAVHRRLGGLSVSFTAVHVLALLADDYVSFGPTDVLVPLASPWRPGPVAWGIVAAYLLVAVQISSLLMRRLPRRWWKVIHASSWLVLWTGLVHGATAGSDAGHPVYVVSMATLGVLTVFLTAYRLTRPRGGRRRDAIAAARAAAAPLR
jgi:DMSO/TMAO reductase YedYZ heme-binding membrane subunit